MATTAETTVCFDPECQSSGCAEHPIHVGDHTYEMHHDPQDHVGDDPCRCGDGVSA